MRLLQELGYDILVRNYADTAGEVDIVCRDGDVLCFVEVKTRHYTARSRPAAAVGPVKRKRLIKTARRYMREINWPEIVYRYDIVEVVVSGYAGWRVVAVR